MSTKNNTSAAAAASVAAALAADVAKTAKITAEQVALTASRTAEQVMIYAENIKQIKVDIAEIKVRLDQKYVSFESFNPIREMTEKQEVRLNTINDWKNNQIGRQSVLVIVSSTITALAFFLLNTFIK